MACAFNIEPLKSELEPPYKNWFDTGNKLLLFRDKLVKVLGALRVRTITGSITVSNLSVGSTVDIEVSHNTTFCFCSYPHLTVVAGIEVTVMAMSSDPSSVTSLSGFVLRIKNVSKSDYSPSFSIDWSRQGML